MLQTPTPSEPSPIAQTMPAVATITHPAVSQTSAPTAAVAAREQMLSMRGSNTIGEQLAPALLRAFVQQQGATEVEVQQLD